MITANWLAVVVIDRSMNAPNSTPTIHRKLYQSARKMLGRGLKKNIVHEKPTLAIRIFPVSGLTTVA